MGAERGVFYKGTAPPLTPAAVPPPTPPACGSQLAGWRRKRKELDGRVACKLAADNYGSSEWWLLLEPVAHS